MWSRQAQLGFTLIEMIIAIVVIGIGLAGVLIAYSVNVRGSADALVGKQLIAITETMMEEVLLKPFVPPVGSVGAGSAGGPCAGPGSAADRSAFDEVGDYAGYQTPDVCGADGTLAAGLDGYSVEVRIPVGDDSLGIGVANTRRATVIARRGQQSVVLDGFKVLLPLPPT